VGAPSAAASGLHGEWGDYSELCCCAERLRFRKDQVSRRDSVARRATFDNWRLAAEQRFTLIIARAEFQDRVSEHEQAFEFYPNKLEVECGLQKGQLAVLSKGIAR
jgi:hypothetical protein